MYYKINRTVTYVKYVCVKAQGWFYTFSYFTMFDKK